MRISHEAIYQALFVQGQARCPDDDQIETWMIGASASGSSSVRPAIGLPIDMTRRFTRRDVSELDTTRHTLGASE